MIELIRYFKTPNGTLGMLRMNRDYLCDTLEDPDNNNEKGISCIPEGEYLCVPHNGVKYKNVWRLEGVPNREAILIHSGNTIKDTRGCILVGRKRGVLNGLPAVLESKLALNELREKLPKSFTINIRSI